MSEWIKTLDSVLPEGTRFTFSINCRSGLIGDLCMCHRCLKSRGEQPDSSTELQAQREAKIADKAMKVGFALGRFPATERDPKETK